MFVSRERNSFFLSPRRISSTYGCRMLMACVMGGMRAMHPPQCNESTARQALPGSPNAAPPNAESAHTARACHPATTHAPPRCRRLRLQLDDVVIHISGGLGLADVLP